jgi:hypothetical protein
MTPARHPQRDTGPEPGFSYSPDVIAIFCGSVPA